VEQGKDPAPPRKRDPGEMTFLEHLEELRWTLVRCLAAFLVGVLVLAVFLPWLTDFLQWPFLWAQQASARPDQVEGLFSRRPMGVFSVMLQVLFLGGLATSLPFMLFAFAQFVAPALTEREKRMLVPALAAGFLLFLIGLAFAFFVVLPAAFRVSIIFNKMLGLELLWGAADYYNLVVWLSVLMGGLFEFPVVLVVLIQMGILSSAALRAQRKIVFVIILVIAAVITPGGDPITLTILCLPLYGLYEAALWVGARYERSRAGAEGDGSGDVPGEEGG